MKQRRSQEVLADKIRTVCKRALLLLLNTSPELTVCLSER